MKNVVLAMFMSLDGYIAGPNGEFLPPPWSAEVGEAWAKHNLASAGHLIYGRANFDFNKNHWTSPAAAAQTETATINRLPKTVVSRTLSGDPGWNANLIRRDLAQAVNRLKESTHEGDIYCFGGAGLAQSLMQEDLIDEYYLMVVPRLLGNGKRLFENGAPNTELKLISAKALDVGSVILHYSRNRS